MSEGQEGGLFSLIADVKYLIAVVLARSIHKVD